MDFPARQGAMHLKSWILFISLAMMSLSGVGPGHGAESSAGVSALRGFGSVRVGAEVRRTLTIRNPHARAIEIRTIKISTPTVDILSHPRAIGPGETGSVEVRWAPRDPGDLSVTVTVETEGGLSLSPPAFRLRGKARGRNAGAHTPPREPSVPALFTTRILRKPDPTLLLSTASLPRELREGHPVQVIDVRGPAARENAQIPGAIQIPLHALKSMEFLKSRRLVLVGAGCDYALLEPECRRLRERGFMASILEGGLGAWRAAGLPLERTRPDDCSLQAVPPGDFFRERHLDHWVLLNACESEKRLAGELVPQAAALPRTDMKEGLTARIRAAAQDNQHISGRYLLVIDDDGTLCPRIRGELPESGFHRVFFLEGGIRAYRAFVEMQVARAAASSNHPIEGAGASCPSCLRE
jgi:rhodanese-related sulfurtransferase